MPLTIQRLPVLPTPPTPISGFRVTDKAGDRLVFEAGDFYPLQVSLQTAGCFPSDPYVGLTLSDAEQLRDALDSWIHQQRSKRDSEPDDLKLGCSC